MTIKIRLYIVLSFMTITTIALGLIGYISLGNINDRVHTIVADRVIPMEQLKAIADAYAVDMVDTSHKVRSGALSWKEGRDGVAKALETVERNWQAYIATTLTVREAELTKDAEAARRTADGPIKKLQKILQDEDAAALTTFVEKELYQAIDPIGEPISDLVILQLNVSREEATAAEDTGSFATMLIQIIGLVATGMIGFGFYTVALHVLKPMKAIENAMRDLAAGDLDIVIPASSRKDEIGAMAAAVAIFKDNAVERAKLEEASAENNAARERRANSLEKLIASFDSEVNTILGSVTTASDQLESTAKTLSSTAEQSTADATNVASAAEQATGNVQTVASASEELAASITEISQQVASAMRISSEAEEMTQRTDNTVRGLVTAAQKIGTVVNLISDIAEQTNLLALNATIEAARAGDAGRGFAVVASEVKSLATQTATATEEIQAQISQIQAVSNEAAQAIRSVGEIVARINETAIATSAAVEEQGAATGEIARNVTEAAAGTQNVSYRITAVSKGAVDTQSIARDVLSAAGDLAGQSTSLKAKVDAFFAEIRAA